MRCPGQGWRWKISEKYEDYGLLDLRDLVDNVTLFNVLRCWECSSLPLNVAKARVVTSRTAAVLTVIDFTKSNLTQQHKFDGLAMTLHSWRAVLNMIRAYWTRMWAR